MTNKTLQVDLLNKITLQIMKKAIELTLHIGTTHKALLGSSGDTIILYQGFSEGDVSRPSQVSVRKYNDDVELLITNGSGEFLFYGKYAVDLGVDFITREYLRIFKKIGKTRILLAFKTPQYLIKVKEICNEPATES